ncbi:CCA tRNA nucleotidyltransferase [Cohnella sp. AR92]|uniref:CCA tRNA nucleotidyltransferase n=1 Tax=Cohnella sp. AR92 TaxID=648716 RepID=UPI000F8D5F6A|nr:CCA tRNA nucleotidyltransferase [Cohnella sp. AR92]RUS48206.1 CCA tRNA nucleotidyltransferase [Cohnella sp. AR92]
MPEQEESWNEGIRLASILEAAGHAAYLVGGCVRDRLLGRRINDIDIATSALPEQVMVLFPKVIPTGLQHGTVTVLLGDVGFEVTTFRHEATYSDARHPDEVVFVRDVNEDLARRDFTINAIACGTDGRMIDPFGGRADLARRFVRCVGAASERFSEDALRMLRGVRFAAEFDFEIDAEAWEAILGQRRQLSRIAMERVGVELDKMLAGSHPDKAIRLLRTSGLLVHAKESLLPPLPELPARSEPETGELGWRKLPDANDRWAALLLLAGADERQASDWMRKLKFSARKGDAVSTVVAVSGYLRSQASGRNDETPDREVWTEAVLRFGVPAAESYLSVVRAFPSIDSALWGDQKEQEGPSRIEQAAEWLRAMPISRLNELAIRGDELVRLSNREAGPWVAEELKRLLLLVALEKLSNDPLALKNEAFRSLQGGRE